MYQKKRCYTVSVLAQGVKYSKHRQAVVVALRVVLEGDWQRRQRGVIDLIDLCLLVRSHERRELHQYIAAKLAAQRVRRGNIEIFRLRALSTK